LLFQLQHSSPFRGITSVQLGLIQSSDAEVSGLLSPSMWCLNTKNFLGWDEDPSRASWQSKCLEDQHEFCSTLL
jgi:hypothetical protein